MTMTYTTSTVQRRHPVPTLTLPSLTLFWVPVVRARFRGRAWSPGCSTTIDVTRHSSVADAARIPDTHRSRSIAERWRLPFCKSVAEDALNADIAELWQYPLCRTVVFSSPNVVTESVGTRRRWLTIWTITPRRHLPSFVAWGHPAVAVDESCTARHSRRTGNCIVRRRSSTTPRFPLDISDLLVLKQSKAKWN